MADPIGARDGLPGSRTLTQPTVLTIRHFPGDTSARDAVQQLGLPWSETPCRLTGSDPWLVWRSPQETIAIECEGGRLLQLLDLLTAGTSATAMAADHSEAVAVVELQGPLLDEWLAHLVDALSIPRIPGSAARARMADASALLARLAPDRLLVIVDKPILPYVQEWLAYAYEGAFMSGRSTDADGTNRPDGAPGETADAAGPMSAPFSSQLG
jgi:sarcosine oxidase gamma subunit